MAVIAKEKLIDRAKKLAGEYHKKDWGCANASFLAVIDSLREFGIELATESDAEEMSKGLLGLSGGVANTGIGTCGALTGAGFAISLFSEIDRKKQIEDKDNRRIAFDNVAGTIGEKFLSEFGGIRCHDVTWSRFGKWYDSWDPIIREEFAMEERERNCSESDDCTISLAAMWAVEFILELIDNPNTLENMKLKYGEVH